MAQFHHIRIVVDESMGGGGVETAVCTITAVHTALKKRITFTGSCTARIEAGHIVELWHYFDFLSVQRQLGPTEPVVNFQIISYNVLRRAIGFTGLLLPVLVVLGGFITTDQKSVMPSISDYYFTSMGDVFVGCLCAVSLFLFCYKGRSDHDNNMANLAAFFAMCIAFFPTTTDLDRNRHIGLVTFPEAAAGIHFTSAVAFFGILAYISIFRFTKMTSRPTPQKTMRNRVYRSCGYTMVGSLLLLAGFFIFGHVNPDHAVYVTLENACFVTIMETVMLWAFGMSWLTKSQAIFADEEEQ